MFYQITIFLILNVCSLNAVQWDVLNCGVDHDDKVTPGVVELQKYPWLGILYYLYYGEIGETRSTMMVALIHKEFVLAPAADVGPISQKGFRKNSRVLLGEDWNAAGRRVRNYVLHPEYGQTYNTLALVQLKDVVRDMKLRPLCPPPERLRNPIFYVVKFNEDYNALQKEIIEVDHIPGSWCKDFYVHANLYSVLLRPAHVSCVVSLQYQYPCVWLAGAVLVARDVWGRWQLLGLGVRGPGCSAPSRYLDIMSYEPWIKDSLAKFQQITISKISNQKYVLRSGDHALQRFGACDPEEATDLVYRESITLRTDNNQYQFLTYNLTIFNNIDYKCLTLELVNASAVSEMRIVHYCPRYSYGPACYFYKGTAFDISVYLMFSDKCFFEMYAFGNEQDMALLDIQKWKWEEGTYYEDFSMTRVEYRGQTYQTDFGFEPLDYKMWVPEYDIWTTTEFDNSSWSSTTKPPSKEGDANTDITGSEYHPTEGTTTTVRTKKKWSTRTHTTVATTAATNATTTGKPDAASTSATTLATTTATTPATTPSTTPPP